jgi:hypothetical protein
MRDNNRELRERIAGLNDKELLEMLTVYARDYRQEALDYARAELRVRGVEFSEAPDHEEEPPQADAATRASGVNCGLIWGAGIALSYSSYRRMESRNAWESLALVIVIPAVFLACTTVGALLYRIASKRFPNLGSVKSVLVSVAGAIILASVPTVAQTVRLNSIAYTDIPTYPGGERMETIIRRGPSAKITVRMHASGEKSQVLRYYADFLRVRNWSVEPWDSSGVLATRDQETLLVTFDERTETIDARWSRSYVNH